MATKPGARSPRLAWPVSRCPATPASSGTRERSSPIAAGSTNPSGVSIILWRWPGAASHRASSPASGERPCGLSKPDGRCSFRATSDSAISRVTSSSRAGLFWSRAAQVARLKSASAPPTTTVADTTLARDRRLRLEPMGTSLLRERNKSDEDSGGIESVSDSLGKHYNRDRFGADRRMLFSRGCHRPSRQFMYGETLPESTSIHIQDLLRLPETAGALPGSSASRALQAVRGGSTWPFDGCDRGQNPRPSGGGGS